MAPSLVVMGVSGCGKSSLAAAVSAEMGLPLVEGDDHHGLASRQKMSRGIALNDADRSDWLERLVGVLREHPAGIVLSCSALKRSYRDKLRGATSDLRFVFMEIGFEAALARVQARGASHFFSPELVRSQFETLEPPVAEPGVLCIDAQAPAPTQLEATRRWLCAQGLAKV